MEVILLALRVLEEQVVAARAEPIQRAELPQLRILAVGVVAAGSHSPELLIAVVTADQA